MNIINEYYELYSQLKKKYKLLEHSYSREKEYVIKVTWDNEGTSKHVVYCKEETLKECYQRAYEELQYFKRTMEEEERVQRAEREKKEAVAEPEYSDQEKIKVG